MRWSDVVFQGLRMGWSCLGNQADVFLRLAFLGGARDQASHPALPVEREQGEGISFLFQLLWGERKVPLPPWRRGGTEGHLNFGTQNLTTYRLVPSVNVLW